MVVKQGTDVWLELRKYAIFTGSTLYTGLGLRRLCDQQEFLKKHLTSDKNARSEVPRNVTGEQVDSGGQTASDKECSSNDEEQHDMDKNETLQHLDWGKDNEKHAVATVVSYALPLYLPGMTFVECGASFIQCEQTSENLVEVSADGLICSVDNYMNIINQVVAKVELKCPYPPAVNSYKLPVYYDLSRHYALQVIVEMEAEPKVPQLIFACYSPESTVISHIQFDNELWTLAKIEVKNLISQIKQNKIPSQRTIFSKDLLPKKIKDFLEENVELLIEVPSVKDMSTEGPSPPKTLEDPTIPYIFPEEMNYAVQPCSIADVLDCVSKLKDAVQMGYNLSRLKAKELFVAILSRSKRNYDPEAPLWLPVFYGSKERPSVKMRKDEFMTC